MRLHFRNKLFDYDSILRFIAIFLFYLVLTILPYISGYHFEMLPRTNINALIEGFHEMVFLLTVFSLGVGVLVSQFIGDFICISIEYARKEILSTITLRNHTFYKYNLDISNPIFIFI